MIKFARQEREGFRVEMLAHRFAAAMAQILLVAAALAAPTVQFNPSGALLQSDGYSAPTLACGASCCGHGAVGCTSSTPNHPNGTVACFCELGWGGRTCCEKTCHPQCLHGACVDGTCRCEPGWAGAACHEVACPGADGKCSGHGKCIDGECTCDYLWAGPGCAYPACANNCSGHGTCASDNTCDCDDGWCGADCGIKSCPDGCSGHGTCGADGKCACWAGWTGASCAALACASPTQCGSGESPPRGLCSMGKCVCARGWGGADCDTPQPTCSNATCGHPRGYCVLDADGGAGSCVCEDGWAGELCAERACPAGCTAPRGRCAQGVCICAEGWSGADCASEACPVAANGRACFGHGACDGGSGKCACFEGWKGDDCSQRDCIGGCGARGMCVAWEAGGGRATAGAACVCEAGWTGTSCEARGCAGGCGGGSHGRCDNGACTCFEGWGGERCEVQSCKGEGGPCSNHGYCVDGACECVDGWQGDECSYHPGCPDDCFHSAGQGHCVYGAHHTPLRCACEPGFGGENCEERLCPRGCSGHGVCDGNTGVCACEPGFDHRPDCAPEEGGCGDGCVHGACVAGACVCEPGWRGERCDHLSCMPAGGLSAGGLSAAEDEEAHNLGDAHHASLYALATPAKGGGCGEHGMCVGGSCLCEAGYAPSSIGLMCERTCAADCHPPHGRCVDGQCLCAPGRLGEDCSGVTCPARCSERGRCLASGKCECFAGWAGPNCSEAVCNTNCNDRGVCRITTENTGNTLTKVAVCECDLHWGGKECTIASCPRDCMGRGQCLKSEGPGGKARCVCNEGWRGPDCSEAVCPKDGGLTCGGDARGACGAHGRCECRPGWRGDACERPTCGAAEDVLECSGWGKCERGTADDAVVAGGGAHCVCAAPRRGARCEEVACPGDCSGRGVCVQPPKSNAGTCVCEPGWEGADCGSRVCVGGCGGNGRCGDDGACVCRAGWGGAHCTEAVCPGAGWPLLDESSVEAEVAADAAKGVQGCGPHGKCELKSRVCVCEAPWAGADCRHKRCPKNCNGRGVCGGVTPGVCQCDPFYAGDACQTFTQCASGCSDHGRCLSGGLCMCDAGWGGADCARKTCGPTGCAGLGRCVDGQCECAVGVTGAACRVAPAAKRCMHGCNGHGKCDAGGKCACDAGWSGGWCQLRKCAADCGHGVCAADGTCACDGGWAAVAAGGPCTAQTCLGNCSGHGACVQPKSAGAFAECECVRGWTGPDCSAKSDTALDEMVATDATRRIALETLARRASQ